MQHTAVVLIPTPSADLQPAHATTPCLAHPCTLTGLRPCSGEKSKVACRCRLVWGGLITRPTVQGSASFWRLSTPRLSNADSLSQAKKDTLYFVKVGHLSAHGDVFLIYL